MWLSHCLGAPDQRSSASQPAFCSQVCALEEEMSLLTLYQDGVWAKGHLGSILFFHSHTHTYTHTHTHLHTPAQQSEEKFLRPCAEKHQPPPSPLLSPVPHGSERDPLFHLDHSAGCVGLSDPLQGSDDKPLCPGWLLYHKGGFPRGEGIVASNPLVLGLATPLPAFLVSKSS